MTRFSVIMPLYNKAPYVRKAVESVVGQTCRDWELIVVDDGSTDGGGDIVTAIADPRIRLVRQENAGVSAARNRGVVLSGEAAFRSPYICFLDADDWWEPTFLEEMRGLIERHPDAGIYGTGYYIVKNSKKRVAPIGVDEDFLEGEINYCRVYAKTLCMPLTSITVSMPRAVFDEMEGFKPHLKLGEDFDLWVRIALKHKVVFFNKPLSNYNQDVDITYRGTHNKRYDPDTFMTFYFDQFKKEEEGNKDLKKLLDRIRVYTLMNFRKNNLFPKRVQHEIAKVDFNNVESIYKFYYKAPWRIVNIYCNIMRMLSLIKQKTIK